MAEKANLSEATDSPSADAPDGLKWALIGASWIAGDFLIDAIRAHPGSSVVGVVSASQERAETFKEKHDLEAAWTDLEVALNDPTVEAVYVSTTNELHYPQVLAAAAAGRHVLCEKPLALNLAEAIEMRDACAEAGVVMATNHAFRDHTTLRTMRRLVADGAIGRPLSAHAFHGVQLPPFLQSWRLERSEAGAGVLYDLTVHAADNLRFLLDGEVDSVVCEVANQGVAAGEIEDTAAGVLRFGSALATFQDSYTVHHAETTLEIHGTEGSLLGRGVISMLPAGDVLLRRNGVEEPVDTGAPESPFRRTVREFTAAARGRGRPSASGDDGVRSLAVSLAARESAETGRRVAVPAT